MSNFVQDGKEGCLAYECRRFSNKTSTTKPKPLEEFLEEVEGRFPFRGGLGLSTKNKTIFLSRNGYLQGKAWKVVGVCRHGKDREPYVLLLKAKSDAQLAIIEYKELISIGYVPLVKARTEKDSLGPQLRVSYNSDCSVVTLWTPSSLQTYGTSETQGKRLCKKYALSSRAYLRDENLLACEFAGDGSCLATLSHSAQKGFTFKTYSILDLTCAEVASHKASFKVNDLAHASISCNGAKGVGMQALVAARDSSFCMLDASLGAICSRPGTPSSGVLKSVSWHRNKGLILCISDSSVFALDQALQPITWHDKLQSWRSEIKNTDLFRAPGGVGDSAVLSWDSEADGEANITSEEETILLNFSAEGQGSKSSDFDFGTSGPVVLSYLRSKQWEAMRALLEVAYLKKSDLRDLMKLVEDISKTNAIADVSSWKVFSFLFRHIAKLDSGKWGMTRASGEALHRIALDYLSAGRYEAAVLIGCSIKSNALNEFLYKYMMQNGEPRLANICWNSIKSEALDPNPSTAATGEPRLLFAPATLKALQRTVMSNT